MAIQTQSRAVEFAGKALSDLAGAQRSQLTGQARMIASFLFAHVESYFEGVVSPGGATVDLSVLHEQIDTRNVKRAEVTERLNFILSHLFDVMEFSSGEASGARVWLVNQQWSQPQLVAFRQALRRVAPTVAYLIQNAGEGPVIQEEYQDKAMLETGAACAIIPNGPQAGRLKLRGDLAVPKDTLEKAETAGQDLSKHPPVLMDGTQGRTIEAIARVARERLGLITPPAPPTADSALGHIAVALRIVRSSFTEVEGKPDLLRERFPSGLVSDARTVCLTLVHSLFVEEERPNVVDTEALEREFTQFLDARRAA